MTFFSVTQSLWNFVQSTTVPLPCSVQNFAMIGQLNWMLWKNKVLRDLCLRCVSDGCPIVHKAPHLSALDPWDCVTTAGCLHINIVYSVRQHYSDATISAMASQIAEPLLFVQPFVQAHIKENMKNPSHWPRHKGPGTRKIFQFDDVIMTCPCDAAGLASNIYLRFIAYCIFVFGVMITLNKAIINFTVIGLNVILFDNVEIVSINSNCICSVYCHYKQNWTKLRKRCERVWDYTCSSLIIHTPLPNPAMYRVPMGLSILAIKDNRYQMICMIQMNGRVWIT